MVNRSSVMGEFPSIWRGEFPPLMGEFPPLNRNTVMGEFPPLF